MNQDIFAAAAGTVQYAGWLEGFGYAIILSHGGGYFTLYMHLNQISVKAGDNVNAQQRIAKAGDTGSLVGPSLLFQIRENKKTVNPELWLKK